MLSYCCWFRCLNRTIDCLDDKLDSTRGFLFACTAVYFAKLINLRESRCRLVTLRAVRYSLLSLITNKGRLCVASFFD